MKRNPLATKCWKCGKIGIGLSTCKGCGEFIAMTLWLAARQIRSPGKKR